MDKRMRYQGLGPRGEHKGGRAGSSKTLLRTPAPSGMWQDPVQACLTGLPSSTS